MSSPEGAAPGFLVGTYTRKEPHVDGEGEGIYFVPDADVPPRLCARLTNPSYLAVQRVAGASIVVTVSETCEPHGSVHMYALRPGPELEAVGEGVVVDGSPCHVACAGELAFVSNYMGGTVSVLCMDPESGLSLVQTLRHPAEDGSGRDAARQEAPHPHCVAVAPDGRLAVAVDLGADKLYAYRISKPGEGAHRVVLAATTELLGGPRHALFLDPELLVCVTELSNEAVLLRLDQASATFTELHRVSCRWGGADAGRASYAAALRLLPATAAAADATGAAPTRVLVSNRGDDSVVVLEVQDGSKLVPLSRASTGAFPRDVAVLSAEEVIVANQNDGHLTRLRLAPGGEITTLPLPPRAVPTPVCVVRL